LAYPRYVTGEHAAPPEDCGGIPSFYAQLEISAIPINPITETLRIGLATMILARISDTPASFRRSRWSRRLSGGGEWRL
jgi:hypothetical protein